MERNSDLTIGDFWGIKKVKPEMDDGMGTSLVILHTDKGREIWEEIRDRLSWFECGEEDAVQPRLTSPTDAAKSRGFFHAFYRLLPFPLFQGLYRGLASGRALLKRIIGWS